MPKIARELSAMAVRNLTKPGWFAVGGVAGLLLQVRSPARAGAPLPRSWVLRIRVADKRRVIGLGAYPQVSLAEARERARKVVAEAREGVDPVAKKRAQRSAAIAAASKQKTFRDCAEAYMQAHATDYTSDKHRRQWASTLSAYAYVLIGDILVSDITVRHVLDVLQQPTEHRNGVSGKLWEVKNETARRLLDRIRKILDFAVVNEYRGGPNPAAWKGHLDVD